MDWRKDLENAAAHIEQTGKSVLVTTEFRGKRYVDVAFIDDGRWYSDTNHNGYENAELRVVARAPMPQPATP